jgi:hypothetical protein
MLYCYFTDSPFETVRLMANYLTISILTILDTQLSRHVDLPKSKALLRHIKWTLREMLHVLFYASTLRQQIINCTGCLTRHARYIQSPPNTKMLEVHDLLYLISFASLKSITTATAVFFFSHSTAISLKFGVIFADYSNQLQCSFVRAEYNVEVGDGCQI